MKLKYVGAGALPGVPARDLTDEETQLYGGEKVLIASGMYTAQQPIKDSEPAGKKAETKDGNS